MKSIVLSLALLSPFHLLAAQRYTAPPDVPATAPNPQYPVHVHILVSHWNYRNSGYEGYGRGNILGDKVEGFDYTYSCSEPFLHNAQAVEFYQARWKKQNLKLEILMQKVGTSHLQKCDLEIALKPGPYGKANASAPAAPVMPPQPSDPAVPKPQ